MKTVTSAFAEKNLDLGEITDADVQATLNDLDEDKDGKLSRAGNPHRSCCLAALVSFISFFSA